MALQGSGAISISQIRTELASNSNSLRSLSSAAGKSTPDSMSEFYGFSNYAVPYYQGGASSISGGGTAANPYSVTPSWDNNYYEEVDVSLDYGFPEGTAIFYFVMTAFSVYFRNSTAVSQRVNHRITSWNNSSNSGCIESYAQTYSAGAFPFASEYRSSESSPKGSDQLINVTVTSGYATPSVGSYIYIAGIVRQMYMEQFQGSYYPHCTGYLYNQSLVETYILNVQVWFDKQ